MTVLPDVEGSGAGGMVTGGASDGDKSPLTSEEIKGLMGLPVMGEPAVTEIEVLDEIGEPGTGVSGAVEQAGVDSVADEEGTSAGSGDSSFVTSSTTSVCGGGSVSMTFGLIFGEGGGLGSCNAF